MDSYPIESLTRRETEMLWLLDARLSNKEIAAVLHISSETIEGHTSSIYRKLVIRARRAAVARVHDSVCSRHPMSRPFRRASMATSSPGHSPQHRQPPTTATLTSPGL